MREYSTIKAFSWKKILIFNRLKPYMKTFCFMQPNKTILDEVQLRIDDMDDLIAEKAVLPAH